MRRRRIEEPENYDRWVVSYADFITLLFAFFTVMYALSHVDVAKLEMFAGSVNSAFNSQTTEVTWSVIDGIAPTDPDVIGIEKEFRKVINTLDASDEISVSHDGRGVVVSISDHLLFESGSAAMKDSASPAMDAIVSVLKAYRNEVVIEGHTDNVPISTQGFGSNWELSTARATNVLRYMLENYSIYPERFSAAGYAEYRPVGTNETPEGRAGNRRVDIVVVVDRK